jgi:hypothetical protein
VLGYFFQLFPSAYLIDSVPGLLDIVAIRILQFAIVWNMGIRARRAEVEGVSSGFSHFTKLGIGIVNLRLIYKLTSYTFLALSLDKESMGVGNYAVALKTC